MKMARKSVKVWIASFFLLTGAFGTSFAAPPSGQYPVAPVFSAVTLDAKSVGSAKLAGKPFIINFFASWCPPCRAEIPDMVSLQNLYAAKGFTFIGVAVSDKEATIRAFAKDNHITYPVVMGDDKLVAAFGRYVEGGIQAIPTSIVVNSSGRITQVITGGRSKEAFESIIVDLLRKPGTTK
ncbi:MAG: TlpA family protein disulfide reductase [Chlorobium sp.]|nr:MAG: TlpA family protein disulfide reductase [Chlorobium sp.]